MIAKHSCLILALAPHTSFLAIYNQNGHTCLHNLCETEKLFILFLFDGDVDLTIRNRDGKQLLMCFMTRLPE